MDLAWPWCEVLNHYVDPLIESHSLMRRMKQDETGDKQGCSVSLRSWLGTLRRENKGALSHHGVRLQAPPSPWLRWAGIQIADALLKSGHASSITSVFEKLAHATIGKKKSAKSMHGWSPLTKTGDNQSTTWQPSKHEIILHLIVKENQHGNIAWDGQWFISEGYPRAHRRLRNATWCQRWTLWHVENILQEDIHLKEIDFVFTRNSTPCSSPFSSYRKGRGNGGAVEIFSFFLPQEERQD